MLSKKAPFLALLGSLSALLGCSDPPNHSQPPSPTPDSPIQARFTLGGEALPRVLDVPFPSDIYLEADGSLLDKIPGFGNIVTRNAAAIQATLATQRGFGLNAGAVFRVDVMDQTEPDSDRPLAATIDPRSLPSSEAASIADDSSVFLVDLDATSGDKARVPCRAAFHDDRATGSEISPVLAVLPARGIVLEEGHRYAAVLTTRVRGDESTAIGPSKEFRAIVEGSRQSALEKLYGDAIERVAELVPPLADTAKIAALTVFTTQSTSEELVEMRATVAALSPPKLDWTPAALAPMSPGLFSAAPLTGFTATLDAWLGKPAKLGDGTDDPARDQSVGAAHDAIAAIGTAVFEAPNFLRVRQEGYLNAEHATVARDMAGHPTLSPDRKTSKVWVSIALPKGPSPMPPSGFPVVILQHGLQGDRSFLLSLANTFAKRGWATAAIEAPTFGTRAVDASSTVDQKSIFPWSSSPAYVGPDGFVDSPAIAFAFFGEFINFGATRDQLRQSAIDLGSLADVLADPMLDLGPLLAAVPGAKFDATRIGYVGDSFGAITGTLLAAVDPRINAFVLNVGGGGIVTEIVSNAPALSGLVSTVGGLTLGFGMDRLDASHPLSNVLQSILDPADPLVYARRIVAQPSTVGGVKNAPKSVILIEAVWDEIVANEGSEALARAIGMPLAAPNIGPITGVPLAEALPTAGVIQGTPVSSVTAVLVQASPGTHGSDLYAAHGRRHYALPFGQPGPSPFPALAAEIPVNQPYLGLQAMVGAFFASAFAGEVPKVAEVPTPLRDFDGDGVEDSKDSDPKDPSK
jgi:dienelactone hydrolase